MKLKLIDSKTIIYKNLSKREFTNIASSTNKNFYTITFIDWYYTNLIDMVLELTNIPELEAKIKIVLKKISVGRKAAYKKKNEKIYKELAKAKPTKKLQFDPTINYFEQMDQYMRVNPKFKSKWLTEFDVSPLGELLINFYLSNNDAIEYPLNNVTIKKCNEGKYTYYVITFIFTYSEIFEKSSFSNLNIMNYTYTLFNEASEHISSYYNKLLFSRNFNDLPPKPDYKKFTKFYSKLNLDGSTYIRHNAEFIILLCLDGISTKPFNLLYEIDFWNRSKFERYN